MIELYLVTGFLGAGKTTLLRNLIKLLAPRKLRLIINEFGKVGVDGALLADAGAALYEVNNGSIFCSCRLDKFEGTLDAVLEERPDAVVVEASGLSDPSAVRSVLGAEKYADFEYKGAICVVDAERFHKIFVTARVCRKQLAVSGLVVVNKADLVSSEELDAVEDTIRENYPNADVRLTRFGQVEPDWLEALSRVRAPDAVVEDRDLTMQKYTVRIRASMSREELAHFIRMFAEETYRVKGFVRLRDGLYLADCVGTDVKITPWTGDAPAGTGALVALAGRAMNPRKAIRSAMAWYPGKAESFE